MVLMVGEVAAVMMGIQSVSCFHDHAAAAATAALEHGTDAVAVTTESSSIEMMAGEEVAARCSVLPVSTLSPQQQRLHY